MTGSLEGAHRTDLREKIEARLQAATGKKMRQIRAHAVRVFEWAEDAEDDDCQVGARDAWNLYKESARLFGLTGDEKAADHAIKMHMGVAGRVEHHIRRDAMVAEAKSDHDGCMAQIELLEEWLLIHGRSVFARTCPCNVAPLWMPPPP